MRVSVCVPVSRVESVQSTIESIIRQTWKDWELIAVGQGSFDNPRTQQVCEIINKLSSQDARIKYIHIEASGASRAKNASLQAANGEIIAEIDDDAEANPDWLETMIQFLDSHPDVDVVGGSVLKPAKTFRGFAVCPSLEPAETMYDPKKMERPPEGWNWISCNVGLRDTVIKKIGYYDEYLGPGSTFPAADDTDLMLRMEAAGIRMASTPTLVVYHTYGYRYGLKAFMKHQYNYAYGNGGMAAKLVLAGDLRGQEWVQYSNRERLLGWIKPFRPHRFIRGLFGWFVFQSAYKRCIQEFRVENGVLVRK